MIKTLAETGFAFRGASALGEVKIAPNPDIFQRKIEIWTPWYLVAQAFMTQGFDDLNAKKGYGREQLEENEELKKENAAKAARKTQLSLANLDKQLKQLDLKLVVEIQGLYFSLNTNYEKKKNLLQIKTEPIKIILIKHAQKFGLSVMGIQMMTQSSFELLFQFTQQMQKHLAIYLNNPVMTDAKKLYDDIITKRIVESKKRSGYGPDLLNIDASTIRPSNRMSDGFTLSDFQRPSVFGPGSISYGGGMSRKSHAPEVPRNKPTIDFKSLKGVMDKSRQTRDARGPEKYGHNDLFSSAPRSKTAKNFAKVDDEFDDASFNDTDEDIKFNEKDIKSPAAKTSKKLIEYKSSPQKVSSGVKPYSPQKSNINAEIMANPRTGPSRISSKQELGASPKYSDHFETSSVSSQPRTGPSRRVRNIIRTPAIEEDYN